MRLFVSQVRDELKAAVASFEPEVLTAATAQELVRDFAEIERLAAAGKALAARRVAQGDAWRHTGARSAAEWLAKTSGSTVGAAAAAINTAKKLQGLPDTDAAVRNGDLSATQAEEIAAAAAANPAAEAELLAAAKTDTVKQLRDKCGKVRAAASDERARHAELHRTRHLRTWTGSDGATHIHIKTTAERAAELHAALSPHLKTVFDHARKDGRREAQDAYAHDAFFELIRTAHTTTTGTTATAAGSTDADTTATGTRTATGVPGTPARSASSVKTVIVCDHAAWVRGHTEPGETCEIAGIGPIPVAVARALSADAFFAAVIRHGTDIVNVAHLGRAVTAEQRTALELRDRSCAIPGCDVTHGLEIDHTTSATGWADTRRTTLNELARLCRHHHHQKTYDGYTLTGTPGHWHWRAPPGPTAKSASPEERDDDPGSFAGMADDAGTTAA